MSRVILKLFPPLNDIFPGCLSESSYLHLQDFGAIQSARLLTCLLYIRIAR